MTELTLTVAQAIVAAALEHGGSQGLKPLAVAVLDSRGALKAFGAQDGTSLKRGNIALGKAHGSLALGMGGRALAERAETSPSFIAAVTHAVDGLLVPVRGGVLIKSDGKVIGSVGISGDASDNDEAAALAGIAAVELEAQP